MDLGVMRHRFSIGWFVVAVIVGAIIGTALGEVIGLLLPESVAKQFFLRAATFGTDPENPPTLNLGIIILTLGFGIKINAIGVIGIIVSAYIVRWYM